MALLDPLLGGLTGVSSSPFRGVLMIVLSYCAQAAPSPSYSPASSKLDSDILLNRGLVTAPINQFHRSSSGRFRRGSGADHPASRAWRPDIS